jgi:hypothetical protein
MTMPAPTPTQAATGQTVDLPPPGYPMVTRMISDPPFPSESNDEEDDPEPEPITWVLSHAHPFVPQMKVVRMFIAPAGVAVYSVSEDGRNGMRNLIPMDRTRLIEEAMPLDVFIDELAHAEGLVPDDPDDDDAPEEVDEESDPEESPAAAPKAAAPPQAPQKPAPRESTQESSASPASDGQPAS